MDIDLKIFANIVSKTFFNEKIFKFDFD